MFCFTAAPGLLLLRGSTTHPPTLNLVKLTSIQQKHTVPLIMQLTFQQIAEEKTPISGSPFASGRRFILTVKKCHLKDKSYKVSY